MIPAELRRRPAKIQIPDVVTERDYDLVCIGSPTWWLSTDIPIRSFLESDTEGIHFRYEGGQVRSLLALISYLGSGDYRERYLGVKLPPTNIQDYHLEAARKFADGLADRLLASTGQPR